MCWGLSVLWGSVLSSEVKTGSSEAFLALGVASVATIHFYQQDR